MPYNHICIMRRPITFDKLLDEELNATIQQEESLALAAPALLAHLRETLFRLETVAHLRQLERELLPYCDRVRESIKQFDQGE